jgi:hypothetical protein
MNTRTRVLVALVLIIGIKPAYAKARTTFVPRSVTRDATFELALTNYHFFHVDRAQDRCGGLSFYFSPFYMKSRNGADLARYFLPDGKTQLNVQQNGTGDVFSQWLGLAAPDNFANTGFDATVSIAPQRKVYGGYFNLNYDFSQWCENTWLRITFAAMRVSHDLNLKEYASTLAVANADGIRSVTQALNNPNWYAGKWSACPRGRAGVDDVQLKLGHDCFKDCYRMTGYLVANIPTGQAPDARYLFEPLVGSRHGGFGGGINSEYQVWDDGSFGLVFMSDIKYIYLFRGTECRSFDICPNGELSRYLLVSENPGTSTLTPAQRAALAQPGINTFTGAARVTPRGQLDAWFAMHAQYCNWDFEAGYNVWWRQSEKVCFCKPLSADLGIFDLNGSLGADTGLGIITSDSTAQINQGVTVPNLLIVDTVFTPLAVISSIDIDSAANPAVTTQKLYAAVAHSSTVCERELMAGFAGSYEFSNRAKALEQLAFWMTFGVTF